MPQGMTFSDISALLLQINQLATGEKSTIEISNTQDFVSVATATLLTGDDPVYNAISQLATQTIFAVRPYQGRFAPLRMEGSMFGNHARKINFFDTAPITDPAYKLPEDGQSVDPYKIYRPQVLQTNYYGQTRYARAYTVTRDQLRAAFTGPEQLALFWTAFVQHYANMIAQDEENLCRLLVANYMAGMTKTAPKSVIYLLDEYNDMTGGSLTATDVYKPENFPDFARFAFGRIKDVLDLMESRTSNFHQNWTISSKTYNFKRHTPRAMQHVYLFSQTQRQIDARVLSDTFHTDRLDYGDFEMVPYWQAVNDRDSIQVNPIYTNTDGTQNTTGGNVGLSNIFGFVHDREAIGYTPLDAYSEPQRNAAGSYTNYWGHYGWRWYNDFTENAALFLLTSADVTAPDALMTAARLVSTNNKDPEPGKAK